MDILHHAVMMENVNTDSSPALGRQQQTSSHEHDIHALPPQYIHDVYKKYQRMTNSEVDCDPEVVDFTRGLNAEQATKVKIVESIAAGTRAKTFETFLGDQEQSDTEYHSCAVYEHIEFPGRVCNQWLQRGLMMSHRIEAVPRSSATESTNRFCGPLTAPRPLKSSAQDESTR